MSNSKPLPPQLKNLTIEKYLGMVLPNSNQKETDDPQDILSYNLLECLYPFIMRPEEPKNQHGKTILKQNTILDLVTLARHILDTEFIDASDIMRMVNKHQMIISLEYD